MNGYLADGRRVEVPVHMVPPGVDVWLVADRGPPRMLFCDMANSHEPVRVTRRALYRLTIVYPELMHGPVEGDGDWEWGDAEWSQDRADYHMAVWWQLGGLVDNPRVVDAVESRYPRHLKPSRDRRVTVWVENPDAWRRRLRGADYPNL